jgi:long-chain fatty acid transport protein
MKKLLLTNLFCLLMVVSFAEGYQVNLLSARQSGMGHTGVALKLGAESMHFNPAGLVYMKRGFSFSTGMSAIFSNISYEDMAKKSWDTDNSIGTPAYFYAAYKPMDNLAFGLSFTTPYGNSLNWGKDWAGAHMVQDISLKAYVFQPTVSYKITDKLSIGAGAMIMTGSVDLNKGLIARGEMSKLSAGVTAKTGGAIPNPFVGKYADAVPASVNLKGDAEIDFGFNVGLLYDLNDMFTFGLSYRSKMTADVKKGDAQISYRDAVIEGYFTQVNAGLKAMGQPSLLPDLNKGNFAASLPMPANTTFGIAMKASQKLTITADVQYVEWGVYKESKFDFSPSPSLDAADVTIAKNYKNTFIYRLGGEYVQNEMFTFRAGAYFDESPVSKTEYNPETPGMDKLGLSVGSTITLMKGLNVDIAMTYIKGFKVDSTVKDPNPFTPGADFAGSYKSTAFIPSLGLSYSF